MRWTRLFALSIGLVSAAVALGACGDGDREEVLRIADEILAGRNRCVAEVTDREWVFSAITPYREEMREAHKRASDEYSFSFSTTGFTFAWNGDLAAVDILVEADGRRFEQVASPGRNLDGRPPSELRIRNSGEYAGAPDSDATYSHENVFLDISDNGSWFFGLPSNGKCFAAGATYSFNLAYRTVKTDPEFPDFRYIAERQWYLYKDSETEKTLSLKLSDDRWHVTGCSGSECANWSTESYDALRWRTRLLVAPVEAAEEIYAYVLEDPL